MKAIRLLKANEIDARVQTARLEYIILVLYKDARVDMRILDEAFGSMNWQRKHEVINDNLFCTVSIYDDDKKQWVSKQDVGIPSNTQKEKGEASDAFKRACTNIGIGRELYTSPFIYIKANNGEVQQNGTRYTTRTKFSVKEIEYNEDREITYLVIIDNNKNERYRYGKKGTNNNNNKNNAQSSADKYRQEIAQMLAAKKIPFDNFTNWLKNNFKVDHLDGLTNEKLETIKSTIASW